jgi:L-methionine (R)-S-oxide reductase
MTPGHRELLADFRSVAGSATNARALMEHVSRRLHQKMTRYNWTGFYLVDPADSGYLIVGPFAGSFTPNARFPLSSGLCGAAAMSGKTIVVADVSKDKRYLAGSNLVKSEIVVPIFVNGHLAAELDVESYFPSTFNTAEVEFCEAVAGLVGSFLTQHRT